MQPQLFSVLSLHALQALLGLPTSRASNHGQATVPHTQGQPQNMLRPGEKETAAEINQGLCFPLYTAPIPALRRLYQSPCLADPPTPTPHTLSHVPLLPHILLDFPPEEICFSKEVTRKMQCILMKFYQVSK